MRSAWRQESRGKGVFVCQGIVFHHPLERGDAFVLVESIATVLGFYNGEPGVLCAAYGKPVLLKAWNVTVGPMLSSSVAMANVAYFDTVVLYIQSEHTPK